MNTTTYRFTGHITAVTGLTVTRSGDKFAGKDSDPIQLSADAGRMPRMGALRADSPVFFPASSLRGAIRRAGRNMIRRAVIRETGNETPWSVDTHYMLTQGVDTTNKITKEKVAGKIDLESGLRTANPFLSLFGRWWVPGHLGIDNAIPENPDCLYVEGRGARSDDFTRDTKQVTFLSPDEAKRLKAIAEDEAKASLTKKDLTAQIKALKKEIVGITDRDEKAELSEQIRALEAQQKKVKSEKKGSEESIQHPFEGFEAIKPGTQMRHRMMVQNGNDLELGLFLACLREFARNPYVGGHRAKNCGEIRGEWKVQCWPEEADAPETLGVVSLSADGFEVHDSDSHTVLSDSLSAWDSAAQALSDHGIDFERYLLVG